MVFSFIHSNRWVLNAYTISPLTGTEESRCSRSKKVLLTFAERFNVDLHSHIDLVILLEVSLTLVTN